MPFRAITLLLFFALCPLQALAAIGNGTGSCAELKPIETQIVFNVTIPEPFYDLSLSRKDINDKSKELREKWLEKNNMKGIWSVDEMSTEGYASGGGASIFRMGMAAAPYDLYGSIYCPYFTRVEVDVIFRTLIVIPKEYKDRPCTFNVINEHELMHYEANKKAAQYYTDRLKKDMPAIIAQIESDYVSRSEAEKHFKDMQQAVEDTVDVYLKQAMAEKANQINSRIDSPEEYASRSVVQRACKDN